MIKVKDFTTGEDLEYYINLYKISRENIIDIKWTATNHTTYGLLIFEEKDT